MDAFEVFLQRIKYLINGNNFMNGKSVYNLHFVTFRYLQQILQKRGKTERINPFFITQKL